MLHLERPCTMILHHVGEPNKESTLIDMIQDKDDNLKIEALKEIIVRTLNGETFPKAKMAIIKYCTSSQNHIVKKLLLLFWEATERTTPEGKLVDELFLSCNYIKSDIQHPNEYLSGSTLRMFSKVKEPEFIESLIPSIMGALESRYTFVRKNAVVAIASLYDTSPELLSDAPDKVEAWLPKEFNSTAIRNGLAFLLRAAPEKAVQYLNYILPNAHTSHPSVIMVLLDVIKYACRLNPANKAHYIRCTHNMLSTGNSWVTFEAANTLVALSSAPTAIRAAVEAYRGLLESESDNNVKLIILERLDALRHKHAAVLQEYLLDILSVLSTNDLAIRKKALELAMSLVSASNVDDLVHLFKGQLSKAAAAAAAASTQVKKDPAVTGTLSGTIVTAVHPAATYRRLLVDALRRCAIRFARVAPNVVGPLAAYLAQPIDKSIFANHSSNQKEGTTLARVNADSGAGVEVVAFLRELAESCPEHRASIVNRVLNALPRIGNPEVARQAVWIVTEFAPLSEPAAILSVLKSLRAAVGPLPLPVPGATGASRAASTDAAAQTTEGKVIVPTINADFTYAAQSAAEASPAETFDSIAFRVLLHVDTMLGTALVRGVAKLIFRLREYVRAKGFTSALTAQQFNSENAQALLLAVNMARIAAQSAESFAATEQILSQGHLPGQSVPAAPSVPSTPVASSLASSTNDSAAAVALRSAPHTDSYAAIISLIRLLMTPSGPGVALPPAAKAMLSTRAALRPVVADLRKTQELTGGDVVAIVKDKSTDPEMEGRGVTSSGASVVKRVDEAISLRLLRPVAPGGGGAGSVASLVPSGAFAGRLLHSLEDDEPSTQDLYHDDLDLALKGPAGSSGAVFSFSKTNTTMATSLKKLDSVVQLTGLGDPVYAEAQATVLEYDLILEISVTNQTNSVLHNVTLELSTSADLKVVDRGAPFNLAPKATHVVQCSLKVLNTESGSVFGNIAFDSANGVQKSLIVLNTISMSMIDYIAPAACSDDIFRKMWADFEWENKIVVNTPQTDLNGYLNYICKITNMRCLTTPRALAGDSLFLSANLYARSLFNEDALINLNLEKQPGGRITGTLRIRSKHEGIAKVLGDKITAVQRIEVAKAAIGAAAAAAAAAASNAAAEAAAATNIVAPPEVTTQ